MVTYLFQPHMHDLLQHSHDDLWSYPIGFYTYSFEHLDLFYEEYFQSPFFFNFDEGEDMIFPEKDFCDESFHPSPFSPCCSTIDIVAIIPQNGHFPVGHSCFQPMFCFKGFQFHTQGQQTLGWEKICFSRLGLIPFFTLSSSMGNLIVFHRFLLILFSRSLGDSL